MAKQKNTKKLVKVCVIILSWNHKKDVVETVGSLLESDTRGYKLNVIVVDNGSDDGTPAYIESRFRDVKIIRNSNNLGFAEGNNIGIRYALENDFDYIALLNDDTIVDKYLVGSILTDHENNLKAGAISPKIYFAKGYEFHKKYKNSELGNIIWYAGGDIDWKNVYGSNHGVDAVDTGQFDTVHETDFTTGCFVMYKRKCLEEVGLYDSRYYLYMEDADHAQRLKQQGWQVLFSPNGKLWHKVAQSSGIGSGLNDYYLSRNRMLFGMTYAQFWTKQALLRESFKLLLTGRRWQRIGILDFYLGRFGKGSWK